MLEVLSLGEALWFTAVTVGINCLVFVLCGILELVERYDLFSHARIQLKPVPNARPPLKKVVLHLAKLHFVVQPLGLPLVYALLKLAGVGFSAPPPPWYELLYHLPLFLLIEDFSFYWLHRALHTPFFYKHIHKLHHQYKHPNSWAVEYAHPLEYAFVNALGLFLGPLLLRPHIRTFWLWNVVRLLEGIDGHCGYDFWFSPFRYFPFRPGANVHDYHHSHNVGNYGSFFVFWDRICGTDMSFLDYKTRQAKRNLQK